MKRFKGNTGKERLWTPLAQAGFRRLFVGQALSDFANWLDFIALSTIIVYVWGHGSMAVAAFSVCVGLPWVVVGPFLSVRMGRFSRKKVLIACDIARALIVLLMLLAPNLAFLLPLVFLKMSVSSIFDPVRQRTIRDLVEPGMLAQVSSLSQMSVSLTKIVGPMAGGVLVGGLGKESAFVLGAVCYLASAWILRGLPWAGREADSAAGAAEAAAGADARPAKEGLRRTWAFIAGKPMLKAAVAYSTILFFLIFLYDGLLVLLIKDIGMSEEQFGLLIGAVGAGSVVGALAAGQWGGWKAHPLRRMTMVGAVAGVLVAVAGWGAFDGLPPALWLWLALFALLGFTGAQGTVPFGFVLQTESTDDTIGPVSALANALQTGSMLIAPVLGAFAASRWSAGAVFVAAGFGMAAAALFFRLRAGRAVRPAAGSAPPQASGEQARKAAVDANQG